MSISSSLPVYLSPSPLPTAPKLFSLFSHNFICCLQFVDKLLLNSDSSNGYLQ